MFIIVFELLWSSQEVNYSSLLSPQGRSRHQQKKRHYLYEIWQSHNDIPKSNYCILNMRGAICHSHLHSTDPALDCSCDFYYEWALQDTHHIISEFIFLFFFSEKCYLQFSFFHHSGKGISLISLLFPGSSLKKNKKKHIFVWVEKLWVSVWDWDEKLPLSL